MEGAASSRETGEFLLAQGARSVMLEPIGYIGFFSRTPRVFDLGGHVSRDVFEYRRSGRPSWFFDAVERFEPEFIVLREGEVERNLGWYVGVLFPGESERTDWLRRYQIAAKYGLNGGGEKLVVWRRVTVAGPSQQPWRK